MYADLSEMRLELPQNTADRIEHKSTGRIV